MNDPALNHYEEQLYSMFKSFDVNNEEALDESAVNELCSALQLEERGAALTDSLFEDGAERVSFARFRSGLLAVLGDEGGVGGRTPDEGGGGGAPGPEPAPDELQPRFVLGAKRYGRRSRPAQPEPASPRAASASRLEAGGTRPAPRARRSVSAMETRVNATVPLAHDTRIDPAEALALCRDLRMHAIDERLVDRIFEDSPTRDTTVGEFFERLDSTLARAVGGGIPDGAGDGRAGDGESPLAPERLLEEWERCGVTRPRRLLADLGLAGGGPAPPASVERALDAELRDAPDAERARLLLAALCVARARAVDAGARASAAAAERDKLRADVAESNARAALIAREVDESHARLEAELKESLWRAETRHAEDARRVRAEADAELERAAAERARLSEEAARRGAAEARLRAESERLAARGAELEERATRAEAALEAVRGDRARLGEQVAAAQRAAALAEGAAAEGAEARARLAALANEHAELRDRADELAAALEATRAPSSPRSPPAGPTDANLSTELSALMTIERNLAEAGVQTEEAAPTEGEGGEGGAVRELEAALEAMRGEYEACEEYWAVKQRAEREAHEAELRAGDARLASLLHEVHEFERRLAPPPPRLEHIPECAALEDQVAALEAEGAAREREHAAQLQRAAERLQRAHRRLAALQRRRSPPPPGGEGCGRCARLAASGAACGARALRAEAAVQRLQARLLAADHLVKELYVENCHLVRLPP